MSAKRILQGTNVCIGAALAVQLQQLLRLPVLKKEAAPMPSRRTRRTLSVLQPRSNE